MNDTAPLLETLEGFAQTLTRGYGIGDVLHDLSDRVAMVLGLTGAGVTLLDDGRAHFVTSSVEAIAEVERAQENLQAGPCVEALRSGQPVLISDVDVDGTSSRWPEYTRQARASGIRAVAGIPMLAHDESIGAIDLYDIEPREWSVEDVRVARILADVATGYLVHASALEQEKRTTEQLRQALATRVIIEQAKGALAAARGVSVDAAFEILRKHARDHNARIHDVAHAVVNLGLRP